MDGNYYCLGCGSKIEKDQSNCPHCEGKPSRSSGCLRAIGILFIFILVLLFLSFYPCFQSLRRMAYDDSAQSAGRSTKLAEEKYIQEQLNRDWPNSPGYYTSDLTDLLPFDPELTADKGVTFIWSYAGDTNYTFTATHIKGRKTFVFFD